MTEQFIENKLESLSVNEFQKNEQNNMSEHFTIGSEEAARLLGVNRSRLSQLTGKGVFSFERRKIGIHNRLFYRLSELLSHQRTQMYGGFSTASEALQFKNEIEEKERKLFALGENKESEKHLEENKILPRIPQKVKFSSPRKFLLAKDLALLKSQEDNEVQNQKTLLSLADDLQTQKDILIQLRQESFKKENQFAKKSSSDQIEQKILFALKHEIENILQHLQQLEIKLNTFMEQKKECKKNPLLWKKKKPKSSFHR